MLKLLLGNPYVLIGIAVAFALSIGSAVWFKHEMDVARKGEAAAVELARLKDEDAKRWEAASNLRDQAIEQLKSAYQLQTDKVQEGRAKEAALRASLDSVRQQNDRLSADAAALAAELDEEAQKAPGDVRELGPIVLRRAEALFQ